MPPTTNITIYIAYGKAFSSLDEVGEYVAGKGFYIYDIKPTQTIQSVRIIFCKLKPI